MHKNHMFFVLLNVLAFEYFSPDFETQFRAFEWPPLHVLHSTGACLVCDVKTMHPWCIPDGGF